MYIDKSNNPRILTSDEMRAAILKRIESFNGHHPRNKIKMSESDIDGAASSLAGLNRAILEGSDVWADRLKEPRSLDSGKHYFGISFCTIEDGKARKDKLWCYDFTRAIGGSINKRDRSMDYYVFDSGAIGMSRQLDATDGVFCFLRDAGGAYVQL